MDHWKDNWNVCLTGQARKSTRRWKEQTLEPYMTPKESYHTGQVEVDPFNAFRRLIYGWYLMLNVPNQGDGLCQVSHKYCLGLPTL
jgi:hypothetical protein